MHWLLAAALLSPFLNVSDVSDAAAAARLRRFALVVGSNDGGPDRVRLRYARSDAR